MEAAVNGSIMFEVPIKAESEKNARGHWGGKARRTADHRATVACVLRAGASLRGEHAWLLTDAVTVMLTRIAPRALDDDNIRQALSACRDGIADAVNPGKGDRDPRIVWQYAQERGAAKFYAVRVRIERRET